MRRPRSPRVSALVIGLLVVAALSVLFGDCTGPTNDGRGAVAGRAKSVGEVITSPSGLYTAQLVAGVNGGGLPTLVPTIDAAGREVYRDTTLYPAAAGVVLAWQEFNGDVLWAISSTGGGERYDLSGGGWVKSASADVPADVRDRVGR